ncbi:sulfatase [Rhodopirellula sp. JC740]|uniref:Sulfatase n=1 Tax=Rhodopirellula halodulae TaxID=2894198 RepID=A0ABS8NE22_9BACT|nr:sulfatase [Rhodopirellula sp. JC740]MCC9641807.1 sulfatase [Rhodopirellula sp. JC740]
MKHSFGPIALIFVMTCFASLTDSSFAAGNESPNILFIMADDCTHLDIGCYGGQAHTPNIDHLSEQGMRFTRCFQTTAMCSATRHAIYTGLYPVKSGAWANHTFVYPDVRSVVQDLKPLGYRVALSGKTHINPPSAFPFEYSATPKKKEIEDAAMRSVIDFGAVEKLFAESQAANTPFALFACSNEPHGPYNKGKEYRQRYDLKKLKLRPNFVDTPATRKEYRNYLAEITFFDAEVGRLLALLEKYGHSENTLVIVTSEQGSAFPGGKWTCYDKGLQSALIARLPGTIFPGATTDAMVEYVDLLPTFVDVAGGQPRETLDGESFWPVLKGEQDQHKSVVYGVQTSRGIFNGPPHYAIRSIRDDHHKLILNLSHKQTFQNYVVKHPFFLEWKEKAALGDKHAMARVSAHGSRPPIELYDIKNDPLELNNLANSDARADTIARLRKQLEAWMKSQGDRGLETELDAYYRMTAGNSEVKKFQNEQGLTVKDLFQQPRPEWKPQLHGDER